MTQSDPSSAAPPPPPPPVTPAPPDPAATATTPPPTLNSGTGAPGASFPDVLKANWRSRSDFERKFMIVGGAGFLLAAISTMLPWVTVFGESFTGIRSGTGKLMLLLNLAAIAYLVFCLWKNQITAMTWSVLSAAGAVMATWVLVLLIRIKHMFSGASVPGAEGNPFASAMMEQLKSQISTGFGLWLGLIVSLIAMAAFAVLHSPELMKGKFTPQSKPLYIAVGIGAAVGLLFGFMS